MKSAPDTFPPFPLTLFHNPTRNPARYAAVVASEAPARR
jgi:hypothetical protein